MVENPYKLGDIIRWRSSAVDVNYDYGMVIREAEIVRSGIYSFTEKLIDMDDVSESTFELDNPLVGITVYAFGDQKVVTLYKNPDDIPLLIDKVDFLNKKLDK